jgi:hypothetical protein
MPNPSSQATRQTTRQATRRLRLARLRDLMATACDLAEPMAYFCDHIARDPVFCRRSEPGDPGIDLILQSIAVLMYGPSAVVVERGFHHYGPLWHGRCAFSSGEAMVLYHSDVDVGIMDMSVNGTRAFLRFNIRCWKMWPAREQPSG